MTAAERGELSERRGRFGQQTLELWGPQANFSAHRAHPDLDGWDYLVEIFDGRPRDDAPLDQLAPGLSCKVQVKTVESDTGRYAFKLSTLRRMVDVTMPWFVLVLIAPTLERVERAYLLHVHGERLASILRRLRLHPKGKRLNKANASFSWTHEDALQTPDATSFVASIRGAIGPSQKAYIDRKHAFSSQAGYAEGRNRATFAFATPPDGELFRAMSEFAVGLRPRIDLRSVSVQDVRFGVPVERLALSSPEATVALAFPENSIPPIGRALLTMSSAAESVTVPCDVLSARALFPFLPPEHAKLRFVGTFVSLIYGPLDDISLTWA